MSAYRIQLCCKTWWVHTIMLACMTRPVWSMVWNLVLTKWVTERFMRSLETDRILITIPIQIGMTWLTAPDSSTIITWMWVEVRITWNTWPLWAICIRMVRCPTLNANSSMDVWIWMWSWIPVWMYVSTWLISTMIILNRILHTVAVVPDRLWCVWARWLPGLWVVTKMALGARSRTVARWLGWMWTKRWDVKIRTSRVRCRLTTRL